MKIANFEKVSFGQYLSDSGYGAETTEEIYGNIKLPARRTKYSAGHDFFMPFDVEIHPGEQMLIPTGIRCNLQNRFVMLVFPRSSLGVKKNMFISNTIPVIDADYYMNDGNEGHIFICIRNCGNKVLKLESGDAFCQAVFVEYGVADNGDIEAERTGGIGSTGK